MPRVKAMKTKRILLSILFPERCACCGRVIPPSAGCCPSCLEKLPVIEPLYVLFAVPGPRTAPADGTAVTSTAAPPLFITRTLSKKGSSSSRNTGVRNPLLFFAERMAEVFLREWGSPYLDGIVPVPMRRRKSGSGGTTKAGC